MYKGSKTHILPTVAMQVDSGYQGMKELHTKTELPTKSTKKHPLNKEQKKKNLLLSKSRVLVENIIGKLKVFRILAERYRNRRRRFGLRINLIAAICNLQLNI
jgi:transposase